MTGVVLPVELAVGANCLKASNCLPVFFMKLEVKTQIASSRNRLGSVILALQLVQAKARKSQIIASLVNRSLNLSLLSNVQSIILFQEPLGEVKAVNPHATALPRLAK